MYIILRGRVKVTQATGEGKEINLAMHQSGDFFGEINMIDNKTVPAMVTAIEDSIIGTITKSDFFPLIHTQEKVMDMLLKIFCSRLRESWHRIQMLSFNNASQRIMMLFLLLSDKYGEKTLEGIKLNIKLTHQDIANMVGISRETVTRVIERLNAEGAVKVLKNKFILISHNVLQKS